MFRSFCLNMGRLLGLRMRRGLGTGIEELLDVPRSTISYWLSREGQFLNSVQDFSVKSVFMEDSKCPQEFRFSCPPAFKTLSIIPACLILHPKL
jgi:hypothetical protein